MQFRRAAERVAPMLVLFAVTVLLHGCSSPTPAALDGSTTTSTTTTTTKASAPTPAPETPGWKLNPIEVRGQHLYDSVTGKTFFGKGLAFPNLGHEDVPKWIAVLARMKSLFPDLNMIRLYEVPGCALDNDCFESFMKKADSLGIYVLVPGTGTTSGYIPRDGFDGTANGCYKMGNVLGFGKAIVQRFNYPNTLAIVIGNEFMNNQETMQYISVLKAYARDLKKHMKMCNTDPKSPTKGQMRSIPLTYASNDAGGDITVKAKTDYLFCGSKDVSIDIFGLNIERWCQPGRRDENTYGVVNKWVGEAKYPGAFIFTEMGCTKDRYRDGNRDWAQVRDFFKSFQSVDGYSAYAYWNAGAKAFNMFDGPSEKSTEYQDGKNFADALKATGEMAERKVVEGTSPTCAHSIVGPDQRTKSNIQPLDDIKPYGSEDPSICPLPPKDDAMSLVV